MSINFTVVSIMSTLKAGTLKNNGSIPRKSNIFLYSPKFPDRFWNLPVANSGDTGSPYPESKAAASGNSFCSLG